MLLYYQNLFLLLILAFYFCTLLSRNQPYRQQLFFTTYGKVSNHSIQNILKCLLSIHFPKGFHIDDMYGNIKAIQLLFHGIL